MVMGEGVNINFKIKIFLKTLKPEKCLKSKILKQKIKIQLNVNLTSNNNL